MPTKLFGTKKAAPADDTKPAARASARTKARAPAAVAAIPTGDPWLSDDARRAAVNAGANGAKPRWFAKRAHRWLGGARG